MKSFDLYDTLMTRDVFQPTDLFYFIGKKAHKLSIVNISPVIFQQHRKYAEIDARNASDSEEVTLDEIYQAFNKSLEPTESLSLENLNKLKQLEMEYEKASYSPIEENVRLFDCTSIIITDIYHSKSFIQDVLTNLGVKAKDIYISSEYKKMKHGSLYDEVLKDYTISCHIGDNAVSDYKTAKNKCINAELYNHSRANRYEKCVYNSNASYDYRAILSGVMKSSRLQRFYENSHQQMIHSIGSDVIAPTLYSYVCWILFEAKKQSIDVVYFIARDGQILYQMACIVNEYLKLDIELCYLYGSRKAWHLPALTEVDEGMLDWVFDSINLTLGDVCYRLELNFMDVKKIFNDNKQTVSVEQVLTIERQASIKSMFLSNKQLRQLVLESATTNRENAIEYLNQMGFSVDKKIAVVDVGWRGRQQVSLSKLLYMGGIYPENGLVGFYLGLNNQMKPYKKDKYYTYFDASDAVFITRYAPLIEVFVSATHGSCIGYAIDANDSQVRPVLRESTNEKMIAWGLEVQQNTVLLFTRNLMNSLSKYEVNIYVEKNIAKQILKFFFENPSKKEAEVIAQVEFYDDQEEKKELSLSSDMTFIDLAVALFYKHDIQKGFWLEGNIAQSCKGGGKSSAFLLLRIKRFMLDYLREN